jgi:hypothetical protein
LPTITQIVTQQKNPDRVSIYIDGEFCTGLRKRTFQDMGLSVGDNISCERVKEMENFFWKEKYGPPAWEKEKVRITKVKSLLEGLNENVSVSVVGFGADSLEFIARHPDQKGEPDLNVTNKTNQARLFSVEVTGTEFMRGEGYWVRPDKLKFALNNQDHDVWVILHYASPEDKFIFIRPARGKQYDGQQVNIKGAGEIMHIFNDDDEEVKTKDEFIEYLNQKLAE